VSDYQHDVFISYRRDPVDDQWLKQHFVPLFASAVRQAITAECQRLPAGIFFDQSLPDGETRVFQLSGVDPGERWREVLRNAIRASRAAILLWSPLYFYSEWCNIEWMSFETRSRKFQRNLLVPVSVHDGESFPAKAREAQIEDLSDFVNIGEGFTRTALYVDFQQRLRALARKVALVVKNSPPFSEWPVVEELPPGTVPPQGGPAIPLSHL
jgi:hypothetical protein